MTDPDDPHAKVQGAIEAGRKARTAAWSLEELVMAIHESPDGYDAEHAANMLGSTSTVLITLADAVEFLGSALLALDGWTEQMRAAVGEALVSASQVKDFDGVPILVDALLRIRVAVFPDVPMP